MIKTTPETKIIIITPTDQGEERITIGPCSTCSYEEHCDGTTYYNDMSGDYSDLRMHTHDFCSNWSDDPAIKIISPEKMKAFKEDKLKAEEYLDNFKVGYKLLFQRELDTLNVSQLASFKKEKGDS